MLTHKNLTANVLNSARWLQMEERRELGLTYLPFSHIFERAVWYLYAYTGATVAYAESIESVARNLLEVRPTVMTSVPRMFEKIYARIIERGLSAGFPKRQIFLWALNVGRRWAEKGPRQTHRVSSKIAAQDLRCLCLQKVARSCGRQRDYVYFWWSAAGSGDRIPVSRGGLADPPGLRLNRDLSIGFVQHGEAQSNRHRRPGD